MAVLETFFGKGTSLGFDLGTGVLFGGGKVLGEHVPTRDFEPTSVAGYETAQDIVLPAGAVVTGALFEVSASAPPTATAVGGIASVRAAAGAPATASSDIVIDFGVLRTVSSLNAPRNISRIEGWRGTEFDQDVYSNGTSSPSVQFTEVQTERLLVTLASSVSPASFAADAKVTTTTPPADLELLVGGERAYTRAGPVPQGFSEQVDVTAALQAALDGATPGADGDVTVPVVLRARVPGTLGLELAQPIGFLRTHAVAFPSGETTTRSLDSEGVLEVALPLPDDASDWIVHRVIATVVATDDDPKRVQPPVGPEVTTDAALVLDPDRRLLVRVPAERLGPFEQLAGVRVSATPDDGGVELSGALLADAGGAPGDPVPKGTFTPLALDAADAPAFVTLPLPQPLKVGAEAPLWFSLAATRGSAAVELAEPGGETADATLRRVMPNGVVRPLSSPVGVRTDVLRLRLVGIPPELAPIDIASTDLVGGDVVPEAVDPALAATGLVSLALGTPAARGGLALAITATAATALTIGPVVVAYTDPASGGP